MSTSTEIVCAGGREANGSNRPAWTLLVTDDHPSVLLTLEYVFGRHGYQTIVATSGAAALDAAARNEVDAALIDLHMPGNDGLSTCRMMRERAIARGRDVPIWIMSAACTSIAAMAATRAGAMMVL